MIVIDVEREIYASWGLGLSTTWHLLNPWTQLAAQKLGKQEGIWGREVDPSGNRWQGVVAELWIQWGQFDGAHLRRRPTTCPVWKKHARLWRLNDKRRYRREEES